MKQSNFFNFKDSLYPILKRIALLKGVSPDCKEKENKLRGMGLQQFQIWQ
jgi:hypothetical protein